MHGMRGAQEAQGTQMPRADRAALGARTVRSPQEPQWTRVSRVPYEPDGPHGPQGFHGGVQQTPDPPIYHDLIRAWADRGRTLPGRHDAEWAQLVAPSALYGYDRFSATRDPRGDGR